MRALIAMLPGDGVGPEVTAEAVRVIEAVGSRFVHTFTLADAPVGATAIAEHGTALPSATKTLCRRADAVLLGAVGGAPAQRGAREAPPPNGGRSGGGASVGGRSSGASSVHPPQHEIAATRDDSPRPEQGLLELRRTLGTFANLRPVRALPGLEATSPLRPERIAGTDLLFVRELTGGIYFGKKLRTRGRTGGERAADLCTYTTAEIERVVRAAATLARGRRSRVTSVDKANVLETSRLWRDVTTRVMRDEFPDVMLEHQLVDAFAMHLLQRPADFDVIVTENMFGDILSDEAAVLAGSIGVLPSASLRLDAKGRVSAGLYEPVHGSAPDLAGRDAANPVGAILSAALLLKHSLGLVDEAAAVEAAVAQTLDRGLRTADIAGADVAGTTRQPVGTREFGEAVAAAVAVGETIPA